VEAEKSHESGLMLVFLSCLLLFLTVDSGESFYVAALQMISDEADESMAFLPSDCSSFILLDHAQKLKVAIPLLRYHACFVLSAWIDWLLPYRVVETDSI
jgi:hypothetical protein